MRRKRRGTIIKIDRNILEKLIDANQYSKDLKIFIF